MKKLLIGLLVMVSVLQSGLVALRADSFVITGSLTSGRYMHTMTVLQNGKILVVGGSLGYVNSYPSGQHLASSELYDPSTGTWTTTGSLNTGRMGHSAALLPDGKVIVSGGEGAYGTLTSAELYNPSTGTWSNTGSMTVDRHNFTLTTLNNGKVLAAGGDWSEDTMISSELYNPTTGAWSSTGDLNNYRSAHTATLLQDGKVLLTGGIGDYQGLSTTDIYDPLTGNWTVGQPSTYGHYGHSATLLTNGKVLIVGNETEIYNPSTDTWASTLCPESLESHTATLLPNGLALIVGGFDNNSSASPPMFPGSLIYNPFNDSWTTGPLLNNIRADHTATLLANGKVLVAGGIGEDSIDWESTAEVFDGTVPSFLSGLFLTNGYFQFTITNAATNAVVQASTNLSDWSNVGNLSGALTFVDSNAAGFQYRFYRIKKDDFLFSQGFGFMKTLLTTNQQLVANPLDAPPNTLESLLPSMPYGSQVSKYDGSQYHTATFDEFENSWYPNIGTLAPGEGAFITASTNTAISFIGKVPEGTLVNGITSGFCIRSSMVPQTGDVDAILGFPAANEDIIYRWNGAGYDSYQYYEGQWYDPQENTVVPTIDIGEAIFIYTLSNKEWIREFSCSP